MTNSSNPQSDCNSIPRTLISHHNFPLLLNELTSLDENIPDFDNDLYFTSQIGSVSQVNVSTVQHSPNRAERITYSRDSQRPNSIGTEITRLSLTSTTSRLSSAVRSLFPSALPPHSAHDPSASRLASNKVLTYTPIRLARLKSLTFAPQPTHQFPVDPVIFSLLAGRGEIAPRRRSLQTVLIRAATENARTPPPELESASESELMFECAHCDARIPLADLLRHVPRSPAACTVELLAEVIAPQHLKECAGRSGVEMLLVDDTRSGRSESTTFATQPIEHSSSSGIT